MEELTFGNEETKDEKKKTTNEIAEPLVEEDKRFTEFKTVKNKTIAYNFMMTICVILAGVVTFVVNVILIGVVSEHAHKIGFLETQVQELFRLVEN
jgi:ABC-type lipoprotein release transport system permease subunit